MQMSKENVGSHNYGTSSITHRVVVLALGCSGKTGDVSIGGFAAPVLKVLWLQWDIFIASMCAASALAKTC